VNLITQCFFKQLLANLQLEYEKLERIAKMTEVEQEHAQLIDLNLERLNRLEKDLEDTKETLLAMMNMMTAYFESQKIEFEEINDD